MGEEHQTIDNGDGTYSLESGFLDFDTIEQGEILTWEYVGPASFSYTPSVATSAEYELKSTPPMSPVDQLLNTTRVDSEGRVWRVVDVDVEALRHALIKENEQTVEEVEYQDPLTPVGGSYYPVEGETSVIQYHSWSGQDCDGDGDIDVRLWNGDSRTLVQGTLDTQEASVVEIVVDLGTTFDRCTGVILRDTWVLTAAHCVTDDATGSPLDSDDISVVRLDISESRGVADITEAPSWLGEDSYDPSYDYALVELDQAWSSSFSDMNLAAASDSTIDALNNPRSLGLPMWARSGVNGSCDWQHRKLFLNTSDEVSTPWYTSDLHLAMDGTFGQSGGPVYFCPQGSNDVCASSDEANVIGVWSGWVSNWLYSTCIGPKVPVFRTWALGVMGN